MNDLLYWVWLSEKCSPDTPTFSILYHTYGSAESIYRASEDELCGIFGLSEKTARSLSDKNTDKASAILNRCRRNNIGIITYADDAFPSRLRTIKNPPVLLYFKGRFPDFDKEVCIGTVGTRTPSSYGCRCAYEIAFDLSLSGAYVVSGMAFGIDSVCHTAALDAGGKTVAFLGCGVDVVYPKENRELYDRLILHGTVISEYAPGTKATRYSFPQRNRLISGLSLGTLIVEAQLKSGAMITAQRAVEQNRDLFAIPGRLGEYNSIGPNSLIQSGAKTVSSASDILKEYEFLYPEKIRLINPTVNTKNNPFSNSGRTAVTGAPAKSIKLKTPKADTSVGEPDKDEGCSVQIQQEAPKKRSFDGLPDEQRKICETLSDSVPTTLEEISEKTKISVSDIMSSLTILEIQGIVLAVPGGSFLLA